MVKHPHEYDETIFPFANIESIVDFIRNGEFKAGWFNVKGLIEDACKTSKQQIFDLRKLKPPGYKKAIAGRLQEIIGVQSLYLELTKRIGVEESDESKNCSVAFLLGYYAFQVQLRSIEMAVALGASQERGRAKAAKKKTVTTEEWKQRQCDAQAALNGCDGNKKQAAKTLGISLSNFENWLRGKKR